MAVSRRWSDETVGPGSYLHASTAGHTGHRRVDRDHVNSCIRPRRARPSRELTAPQPRPSRTHQSRRVETNNFSLCSCPTHVHRAGGSKIDSGRRGGRR